MNNDEYVINNTCLICGNSRLFNFINLSDQPLANSYHKGEVLPKYPLQVCVCDTCWHSQLTVSVNPSKMFEEYLYISDTSKTLTSYFEWATEYILNSGCAPKNALEIACNSGLLLKMFKDKNIECLGIDPALNLRKLSLERGLDVYTDYWDLNLSNKVKKTKGLYDLVIAFHVLPHVQDPNNFIQACKNIVSNSGRIFIQTSQCDMFLNNEFDAIYHEHTSYFTASSILELAHRNDLFVSSIIKTDIHGKSFLFSLSKMKSNEQQINSLILDEKKSGIFSLAKYQKFNEIAINTKINLISKLSDFKSNGYTLIGYGAAAKGNTLLNYLNFRLDIIIDDNYMKWGYKTPGLNIDIHSIDFLNTISGKICFIPLAWNFYSEIKERVLKMRKNQNDVFIRYFPDYSEDYI